MVQLIVRISWMLSQLRCSATLQGRKLRLKGLSDLPRGEQLESTKAKIWPWPSDSSVWALNESTALGPSWKSVLNGPHKSRITRMLRRWVGRPPYGAFAPEPPLDSVLIYSHILWGHLGPGSGADRKEPPWSGPGPCLYEDDSPVPAWNKLHL